MDQIDIPTWVDDVYRLTGAGKPRKAIRVLFREVDALLTASKFKQVDGILKRIDLSRLTPSLLVAVLSITFQSKQDLNKRAALMDRVRIELAKSNPNKVECLLGL